MEPDRKVRDRIAQPSDIATKQQHQPGSKNKHIHKKTHPVLSLRFCVRWHPSYHILHAGQVGCRPDMPESTKDGKYQGQSWWHKPIILAFRWLRQITS